MSDIAKAETIQYTDPKQCCLVREGKQLQVISSRGDIEFVLPAALADKDAKQVIDLINTIYGKGVAMGIQIERFMNTELKGVQSGKA